MSCAKPGKTNKKTVTTKRGTGSLLDELNAARQRELEAGKARAAETDRQNIITVNGRQAPATARGMLISMMESGQIPGEKLDSVKVRLYNDEGTVRYKGTFNSMSMGTYSSAPLIKSRSVYGEADNMFVGIIKPGWKPE